MKAKILHSETDYEKALAYLETLMETETGSAKEDDLELFSFLVENYEKEHFPLDLPDPIAAIEFRMEQQGLTHKDMQKYLGSQSKVSEVLRGKRPLSLSMIHKLHFKLGIPAEVLLQEKGRELEQLKYRWQDYPFREMYNHGYFPAFNGSLSEAKQHAGKILSGLFSVFQGALPEPLYCKRSERPINEKALLAWQARILSLLNNEQLPAFERQSLDDELLRKLVHLSYYDRGPQLVREYLNKKGIHFVTLAHLQRTYLDGATFLTNAGHPVIAITLRYDRLDNFWFTLFHELAHVYLHLNDASIAFFDETIQSNHEINSPQETETNTFARNALVSPDYWVTHCVPNLPNFSRAQILQHAEALEISPAILAGRVRWEIQDFKKHSNLIGRNQVRDQFRIADAA